MNNALFIILVNAIILAAGILVVLIACFTFDNFFPLLTIMVDLIAIIQLMGCGACAGNADFYLSFEDSSLVGLQVSWMFFGLLVVVGYAIPALLYRGTAIPEVALYFTWIGGTTILAAMIIYMKIIYIRGSG